MTPQKSNGLSLGYITNLVLLVGACWALLRVQDQATQFALLMLLILINRNSSALEASEYPKVTWARGQGWRFVRSAEDAQ
jgi:hypothetical protein